MFHSIVKISTLSYLLLLVPLASEAEATDSVAIVNDTTITQQDYDVYAKARAEQTRTNVTPDSQMLIEELIDRELLRQAALTQKLDQTPEFQKKLKQMQDNLLMAMVMQDYLDKHSIDDAKLKEEYDQQIAKMKMPSEYKARHILVETEQQAKDIIEELKAGKPFTELAKNQSTDTDSANQGGDLGWITQRSVVPEFGEALKKLAKGQYTSAPVKSQFGWHVIQLDDIRAVPLPPFESVKEKIRSSLQGQQMQNYMDGLRKQAKIEMIKQTDSTTTTTKPEPDPKSQSESPQTEE